MTLLTNERSHPETTFQGYKHFHLTGIESRLKGLYWRVYNPER